MHGHNSTQIQTPVDCVLVFDACCDKLVWRQKKNRGIDYKQEGQMLNDPYSPYAEVLFEVISLTLPVTANVAVISCHFTTE